MEEQKNKSHHVGDEKLGNENQTQEQRDSKSDLKLTSLEDKRPADPDLPKGWSPDSDTSRGKDD